MSRKEAILLVLYSRENWDFRVGWREHVVEILKALGVTDAEVAEAYDSMGPRSWYWRG